MADLRAIVEELGYADVRTLANSGNIAFTAPGATADGAASRIERAVAERLGVVSRVTVLAAGELAAAVVGNPLPARCDDPSRLQVAFLADPADRARLVGLTKQRWDPEAIALGARVAYLWCPDRVLASRVLEAVGRTLGDAVTVRTWATVQKLLAIAENRR
jgi:uncharacterized protein (DUF1697 family)